MKSILQRKPRKLIGKWPDSVPEIERRLFANRGLHSHEEYLADMLAGHDARTMLGMERGVKMLVAALKSGRSILITGDYDCDGATATTVMVRGIRMLAQWWGQKQWEVSPIPVAISDVSYTIPNRFKHGYGLSKELLEDQKFKYDLIITVDSGVASHAGITYAKSIGSEVIVTDHHLPGDTLPDAYAIINPNLRDDPYPNKALAGVGVAFRFLQIVHATLFPNASWTALDPLLDIVALGTVADLVPLSAENRQLVQAGLSMIRNGQGHEGIKALCAIAGKNPVDLTAQDFGFLIAPRLNAAGRLEDMTIGVELLLSDDPSHAKALAARLDAINKDRQAMQENMMAEAEAMLEEAHDPSDDKFGVVVYRPHWHAGIVGLVASKVKELLHRPVFAFAPGEGDETDLRGSGRSIDGFHLRDALAELDTSFPGLITKFGGHAMAAGLSLPKENLERFALVFNGLAASKLTGDLLELSVMSDGELKPDDMTTKFADWIAKRVWGQAFPLPTFDNVFDIVAWTKMGKDHVKFCLRDPRTGKEFEALYFRGWQEEAFPSRVRAVYEFQLNKWNDTVSLQLLIKHFEPVLV
jgi:single-stranded-DNA-specific exonuclease